MFRCLLVIEYELISNERGGGRALANSHLQLLANSGFELHAVILVNCEKSPKNEAAYEFQSMRELQSQFDSSELMEVCLDPKEDIFTKRLWSIASDPAFYRMGSRIGLKNCKMLQAYIERVKPDLIWAEDLFPATLARRASSKIPVVYSHHDWKWRIKSYRSRKQQILNWRKRFDLWMGKRHEQTLVRQVDGCISASVSESQEIRQLGCIHVEFFPTLYEPINMQDQAPPGKSPRIVHLGGMQTTANLIGLERFLQITWPELCRLLPTPPEFWVIGSLKGAPPDLIRALAQAGAVCTGFVENLNAILRPFDLHIIPWEYNTGTRTRIPLALNYHQVLVSTRAAAACMDGLRDGRNCVLAEDLHQMAKKMVDLIQDEPARQSISQTGRVTFTEQFTLQAQQNRFNQFIAHFYNKKK